MSTKIKEKLDKAKKVTQTVWFSWVITTIVERIPLVRKVFAYVDGHKTNIGRVLLFIAALMAFVVSPDGLCSILVDYCAAHPELKDHAVKVIAVVGWLLTELGLQHKTAKNLVDEGIVKQIDLP